MFYADIDGSGDDVEGSGDKGITEGSGSDDEVITSGSGSGMEPDDEDMPARPTPKRPHKPTNNKDWTFVSTKGPTYKIPDKDKNKQPSGAAALSSSLLLSVAALVQCVVRWL